MDDALSTLVTLEVIDDGIGIAPDALSRLFTVFSQADVTIGQRYGGSGLGLAIVKSLVELMKGSVCVQSAEGRGSKFSVTIPLLNESVAITRESPMQRRSSAAAFASVTHQLASKSAVVALHDSLLAANLSARLRSLGMKNVAIVRDRELLLVNSAQTDVIFCDELSYPTAKSASTGQLIMVDWQRNDHIASSSSDNKHHSGCAFLRKPIRQQQLYETVSGVLQIEPLSETFPAMKRSRQQSPNPIRVRILVVDDNIVNRKAMQHMLESIGCERASIYTASNGREAISSLEQQKTDIVLMDLDMPVMNGYDATRAIRKRWPMKKLCIIAVTASATEHTKKMCFEAGMNGFLIKPVRCAMLSETIQQAIQKLSA